MDMQKQARTGSALNSCFESFGEISRNICDRGRLKFKPSVLPKQGLHQGFLTAKIFET